MKSRRAKHPISGMKMETWIVLGVVAMGFVLWAQKTGFFDKLKQSMIARQVTPRDRFEYSDESRRYEYIHPY